MYALGAESTIDDERIKQIVSHALLHAPSPFNSQSARVVVLFSQNHAKLWSIVENALRSVVPVENFDKTKERVDSFAAAFGTVLFFEDQSVVTKLQTDFALYKDNFPGWSLQSSGMLQYIVWTALEAEGLGASLQHYNPLIDKAVQRQWNIPADWRLISQMPFGKPLAQPGEKEYQPLDSRLLVFN